MFVCRRVRVWLSALALVLVVLSASVPLAFAHNTTVSHSDPADGATLAKAPAQVSAQFTEELDTKGSTMTVADATGRAVSEGNGQVDLNDPNHQTMIATLPTALPAGTYTVKWHALLTDGDSTDGTFKFTVAAAQAAASDPTATPAAGAAGPTASPTVAATSTAAALAQPAGTATAAPTLAPTATSIGTAPQGLPTTGGSQGSVALAAAFVLGALALAAGARARSRS